MKFSDNPEKRTTPGIKQVWRLYNNDGTFKADVVSLSNEVIEANVERTFYHPSDNSQCFTFTPAKVEALLNLKIKAGKHVCEPQDLHAIKKYAEGQLNCLDSTSKRILNPHIYKVSLTEKLKDLKQSLTLKRKK